MLAAVIASTLGVTVLVLKWYRVRRRVPPGARPLPGPRGLPYIGRIHDVPVDSTWLKFHEWSREYGPIYTMTMFGHEHVWISTGPAAKDLLSKRSSIYSDRPVIPNLPDNRTSGDYLALLGRTDTWKRQRKLANDLMLVSSRANLHAYPTHERDRFLYLMCCHPVDYVELVEQFTSRTISRLAWSTPRPGRFLRHTTFGLLSTISPAGALPNVVTFLRYLPKRVSPWKLNERKRHLLEDHMFQRNVETVAHHIARGRAGPSFIGTFRRAKLDGGERARTRWGNHQEALHVVGLMAIAGALTIGSPIQSYILAMCHFPQWQQRLQKHIDDLLGGSCPQWSDREVLPLLRAVVKEVIRWRPAVPTGIPHAIEKDDVYGGFFIPAGATIHALEWAITRDEAVYPDAEGFNPDRWIDPTLPTYRAPLTRYPCLAGFSQFGFGRRTCQGIPIVEQDLFLALGGLAWGLSISRKRDPVTGSEMEIHWNDYSPLLIAKPYDFPFDAVARSSDRVETMRDMFAAARKASSKNNGDLTGSKDQLGLKLGGTIEAGAEPDLDIGADGWFTPPESEAGDVELADEKEEEYDDYSDYLPDLGIGNIPGAFTRQRSVRRASTVAVVEKVLFVPGMWPGEVY